jgi:predicted secreted Zn-dependent protease
MAWPNNQSGVSTAAIVDVVAANNATWQDAFQFDPPSVTGQAPPPYYNIYGTGPTWGFTGVSFRMDIKTNINASGPSLTLLSSAGQFVIDDYTNRILHANVPESVLQAALIPGTYIYDFIMCDGSVPTVRTMLMRGKFVLVDGVTGG